MNLKPLSGNGRLLDSNGAELAKVTYRIEFHLEGEGQNPAASGYFITDVLLDITQREFVLALADGRQVEIIRGDVSFDGHFPVRYPFEPMRTSDLL